MDKAMLIGNETMPLNQKVEGGHGKSQMSLKVLPDAMSHVLELTDPRQHGENRFDHHAPIPGATLSDRMQQLNPIGVGHPQHGRLSQKPIDPIRMRFEQPKQLCPGC
ncbi:MAG: hypothetical protein QW838_02990 [Candidatus Nitrosotenuis sp.]